LGGILFVALILALAGCVHAPDLQIGRVTIEGIGADLVTYTVEIHNAERHSPFSRCRTAAVRDRITVHGTLSRTKEPGTIDAGSAVFIDPASDDIPDELAPGHHEDGSISFATTAPLPKPGYLVIEVVAEGDAGPCAVLRDRKAIALP